MFDLASTIAPASRMRATIVASCLGIHPLSASEPAVVCRSFVSKLSFTIIGTQCSGPVSPSFANRLSSESAIASAFGFNVTSALMAGPCLSYAAIRARYFPTSAWQVSVFALNAACTAEMVVSSMRKERGEPCAVRSEETKSEGTSVTARRWRLDGFMG